MQALNKIPQSLLKETLPRIESFKGLNTMIDFVDDKKPLFSLILISSEWNPL